MRKVSILLLFLSPIVSLFAQRGKDGPRTVTAANTIVNEYTAMSASVGAGTTTIPVTASSLNANGRFTAGLAAGDLVMIYQVQGVFINGYASGTIGLPNDTTWGRPLDYYNTGRYEFAEVLSVPNSTSITLRCGLTNNYDVSSNLFFKTIVVRVPRYTTLTINSGGVLTCDDWNGTIGGVLAVEVQGNTVVNTGGSIDATGKGFRGGSLTGDNASTFGVNNHASTDNTYGSEKGEGVTGYQAMYDIWGGRYGRGAAANAGGGGCAHNGGGGGGANAPSSTIYNWKGWGIPDLTGTNYTTAWNLDNTGIATSTNANSAGGGRGGYSFSSSNSNAITTAPGNAAWGGDNRNKDATGLGGRALDYSTGRIFFGGGGGAGDQNNGGGGNGADGGGIIYLMMYGNISGNGTIQSNGNNGSNGQGGSGFPTGIDAGGGGGAGGVVILNAVGTVANTLTLNTNGGNGGNQVVFPTTTNEAEGPGGGGGGGYIAVSNGTPTRNSNGGNNGTTNSNGLTEFLPNGATRGCGGITSASITNFTINASNVTICSGTSTTLSASTSGTLPAGGVTFTWYDAEVGGNLLGSGATYNTGVLTTTTTYYVGTCPGTYRIPVVVTVNPLPSVSITATSPVCAGSAAFNLSGSPSGGTWSGTGITNTTNGTFDPTTAGTGTFTITYSYTDANGCSNTDTEPVVVSAGSTATITPVASVCTGTAPFNMVASPAGGTWSGTGITNASTGTFNPATAGAGSWTITYTIGGACSAIDQETVTVTASPTMTSANSSTICSGATLNIPLTSSIASTYSWIANNNANTTGESTTSQSTSTINNTITNTGAAVETVVYTVTPTSTSGSCPGPAQQVTVTINPVPAMTSTNNTTICSGATLNIALTSNVASTYTWIGNNNANTTGESTTSQSTSTINNTITNSSSTAQTVIYTVTPTSSTGSCPGTAQQVTVTINPTPAMTSANTASICSGTAVNIPLTSNVASTYTWIGNNNANTTGESTTSQSTSTINNTITNTGTAVETVVYTVTPTSSSGSCPGTAQQVTVTINPTPTMTSANTATVCSGNAVSIPLTSNVASSYTWIGNDNTNTSGESTTSQSTSTISNTITNTGTAVETVIYTVTPTSSVGSCPGTAQQVTVTINPTPLMTSAGTATVCSGSAVNLAITTNPASSSVTWNAAANTSVTGESTSTVSSATITDVLTNTSGTNQVVTYTVSYTSATGSCAGSASVNVTVNAPVNATISPAGPFCVSAATTTLTAAQSGGTWTGTGITNGTTGAFDPATAGVGTFNIIYTIGGACPDDDTIAVTVNNVLSSTITPVSALCNNAAAFNMTGASPGGTWSGTGITDGVNGTFDPSVSGAGTFTVTYSISGSCGTTSTETVSVLANANASITSVSPVCDNAAAFNLSAAQSGGTWTGTGITNGATGTFDPATSGAGTFNIVYTIAGTCGDDDTIAVVVNATPNATINTAAAVCSADTAFNLSAASGGGTWSGTGITDATNGTFDPSSSGAGTFTVTYSIAGSCPSSDTALVNVIQNANATITSANPAFCASDAASNLTSSQSGGTWSGTGITDGTNGTFDPATSGTGTFTVYYTISGQCGDADSTQVTVSNALDATINATSAICANGNSITLTAADNGGIWSGTGVSDSINGTFDPTLSGAGTFTVTYSIAGSCGSTDTAVVTVNSVPNASITNPGTICQTGGTITLSAASSGGTWSGTGITNAANGTFDPGVSGTGTFQIIYTIAGSCPDDDTISVVVTGAISSAITSAGPFCTGDAAVTLTAANSGGTWSGTGITDAVNGVFDPATAGAGTQTITYTISGNCGTSSTTNIVVNQSANASITSTVTTFCQGDAAINFTAAQSGGTWTGTGITSAANGTFDPATSGVGTFSIIYTIAGSCGDDDTLQVTVGQTPVANATANITSGCAPLCVDFTSGSSSSPSWSFGDGAGSNGQLVNHCFNDSGTYSVQLINTTGACADTDYVTITVFPVPVASFNVSPGLVVGPGEPFTFTNTSTNASSYEWNFNDPTIPGFDTTSATSASWTYSVSGSYCMSLLATSSAGCADSSILCLLVIEDITVVVPNVFTPNGDGTNDVFSINSTGLKDLKCELFDRWGLKMASFSGLNGYWDGAASNGKKAPNGTYYYVLDYTDLKGDTYQSHGYVQLIDEQ